MGTEGDGAPDDASSKDAAGNEDGPWSWQDCVLDVLVDGFGAKAVRVFEITQSGPRAIMSAGAPEVITPPPSGVMADRPGSSIAIRWLDERTVAIPVHVDRALAVVIVATFERAAPRSARIERSLIAIAKHLGRVMERDRAREQLSAVNETKDAIFSAVSHELRTPLTSVLGFAQLIQQQGDSLTPEQLRSFVDRIAHNAGRLDRLLGDLLDLDRLKRGILHPVRRATRIDTLLTDVVSEAAPAGRVITVLAPAITARVDAPKVERIVENLLANAVKHTRADARIWIKARTTTDGLELTVEDDGEGIADDVKASIFQAFSRGPGSPTHAPGSGLGLTLVLRFAELHGGRAWVEDRAGGGASFKVVLPVDDEHAARALDLTHSAAGR